MADNVLHDPAPVLQAQQLAKRLPRLHLSARRVASAVYGLHGRRRAGPGETFWQYRLYAAGEEMNRIDWRRSAREEKLYVRQREWEAAHSLYLWVDPSASMHFQSHLAPDSKHDRAVVLACALAQVLVTGGERVGVPGMMAPTSRRSVIEDISRHFYAMTLHVPPDVTLPSSDEVLIFTDALALPEVITRYIDRLSATGARGHLIQLIDPVEETFPYEGELVLEEAETHAQLTIGDARAWGDMYRSRFNAHKDAIRSICRGRGWSHTLHHTDTPASAAALAVMMRLMEKRA